MKKLVIVLATVGTIVAVADSASVWWGSPTSYPVDRSPRLFGFNSQTPGLDSVGTQLNSTYFDRGRELSQPSSSQRLEKYSVHYQFGNLAGFQEGLLRKNGLTGQEGFGITRPEKNSTGAWDKTKIKALVTPNFAKAYKQLKPYRLRPFGQ